MPQSELDSPRSQAYTALYRRWRPQLFSEVVGQKHVTRTLQNALTSGRVAHAYLFCGLRGTGKTTMAKLLARALNCQEGVRPEPCNSCPSCSEILEGRSVDVLEIDAASNRGIDEIRDLRDKALYTTAQSRYKVYIVDEVHMLTNEAFNALLKILEEPPPKVIFILATTEVYKLPLTVISRCQRFDFHLLGSEEIAGHLKEIAATLNFELDSDTLYLLAQQAEGSMRDALGFLEQCRAYGGKKLSYSEAREILGLAAPETVFNLLEAIVQEDTGRGLAELGALVYEGRDLHRFIRELILYLRKLVVLQSGEDEDKILAEIPGLKPYLPRHKGKFDNAVLLEMLEILQELIFQLRSSSQPQFLLELTFLRLQRAYRFRRYFSPGSLFQYLETLEEKLQASGRVPMLHPGDGDKEIPVARQRREAPRAARERQRREDSKAVPEHGERRDAAVSRPPAPPSPPAAPTGTPGAGETEKTPALADGAAPFGDFAPAAEPVPESPPEGEPPPGPPLEAESPPEAPPAPGSEPVPGTTPEPGSAPGTAPAPAGFRALEGPQLQQFWDEEFLPALKKQRRHILHALLLEAIPLSCREKVFMLAFPPTHSIHKERVESSRHKKNLEALLSSLLGAETVCRITLQENDLEKENKEAATGTGTNETAGSGAGEEAASGAIPPVAAGAGDSSFAAADAAADTDAGIDVAAAGSGSAPADADADAVNAGAASGPAPVDATAAAPGKSTPHANAKREGDYFMQRMVELFGGKLIATGTEKLDSQDFWKFEPPAPEK